MTARDAADNVAENPFVKLIARMSMFLIGVLVVPIVAWNFNTLYTMDRAFGGTLVVQSQQQEQIASIVTAQTKLATSLADLSIAQARMEERISVLNNMVDRNYRMLDTLRDRVNRAPSVPDK